MKKIALAVLAAAALAGCSTGHHTNDWTAVGQNDHSILFEYKGVQDIPDSWPCGDHDENTCVWLPKIK